MTNPLGQTTTYAYNANGDLVSMGEASGQTKHYTYDATGHLTQFEAAGAVKTLDYDATGQVTNIVSATGREALIEYDTVGRLAAMTLPDGTVRHQTFDAEANRTSDVDPVGNVTQ